MVAGSTSFQDSSVDESTMQLVIDQLEELVVAIIEEVRERPAVVLAIAAGIGGAVIGARLATRRRAARRARRVARPARRLGDVAALIGLGVRLLQNPIVRGILVSAVERQLKRRLAFRAS
jgi:hypothetical protein